MVLMGKVNRQIVSLVNRYGGKAVGLSGKDANLLRPAAAAGGSGRGEGRPGPGGRDHQGVHGVAAYYQRQQLYSRGFSIAVWPGGESLNINADHVAGKLATALQAEKLIVLTDVEGIYDRRSSEEEFVSRIRAKEAPENGSPPAGSAGMIPQGGACSRR